MVLRVRLYRFLMLRILLWKHLYQNPATKVLEWFLIEVVFRHLWKHKKITRPLLLSWNDADNLYPLINRFIGRDGASADLNVFGCPPIREAFASRDVALDQEEFLFRRGEFTLIFDTRHIQPTKSKTNRYFVERRGRIMTFAKGYPEQADVIAKAAASTITDTPYQVVHFPKSPGRKISKRLQTAWQEARARWRTHPQ